MRNARRQVTATREGRDFLVLVDLVEQLRHMGELTIGSVRGIAELRTALGPALELGGRKGNLEGDAGVICVHPAQPATQRRQVREAKDDCAHLANWADCPKFCAALGNVVDVACILASADADPGSALNIESWKAAPLRRWLYGLGPL